MSGAPKVRAMELIEVGKTRRGLYGGVVGYLDFAGQRGLRDRDSHRLMRRGTAHVQAGGGRSRIPTGRTNMRRPPIKAKAVPERYRGC